MTPENLNKFFLWRLLPSVLFHSTFIVIKENVGTGASQHIFRIQFCQKCAWNYFMEWLSGQAIGNPVPPTNDFLFDSALGEGCRSWPPGFRASFQRRWFYLAKRSDFSKSFFVDPEWRNKRKWSINNGEEEKVGSKNVSKANNQRYDWLDRTHSWWTINGITNIIPVFGSQAFGFWKRTIANVILEGLFIKLWHSLMTQTILLGFAFQWICTNNVC